MLEGFISILTTQSLVISLSIIEISSSIIEIFSSVQGNPVH